MVLTSRGLSSTSSTTSILHSSSSPISLSSSLHPSSECAMGRSLSTSSLFPNSSNGWRSITTYLAGLLSTTRSIVMRACCSRHTNSRVQGLGTSDDKDARDYFNNMPTHMIPFSKLQSDDRSLIDMAFSKKKVEDRKEWLRNFTVRSCTILTTISLLTLY